MHRLRAGSAPTSVAARLPASLLAAVALLLGCSYPGWWASRSTPSPVIRPTITPTVSDYERRSQLRKECPPETSLATGELCAPPCWEGIVPGETTAAVAESALRKNARVRQETVDVRFGGIIWGSCWTYAALNRIELQGDVVVFIRTDLGHTTVEQVVQLLGPPEGFLVSMTSGGGVELSVALEYPSRGITVEGRGPHRLREGEAPDRGVFYLEAALPVKCVYYYVPGTYLEVAVSTFGRDVEDAEARLRALEEWQGFGWIDVY